MARWQVELEDLVRDRFHHLVAYAVLLAGDRAEAEDLVQDALIAAFSARARMRGAASAESYVRRAIASRFIDSRRRSRRDRDRTRDLAVMGPTVAMGPDASVAARVDITTALATLPPRERACVVLRHLEGASTAETARTLGLSDGAVKRYLADGLGRLNHVLGTHDALEQADVVATEGGERRG